METQVSALADFITAEADKKKKTPSEWINGLKPNQFKAIKYITHTGKLFHPNVKSVLRVSEDSRSDNNGYIYTINVPHVYDSSLGTASNSLAEKLINFKMQDGRTLYEHYKENDPAIKNEIESLNVSYAHFCNCMNEANPYSNNDYCEIDPYLKAVYFPVDDNYENLVIVPSASLNKRLYDILNNMQYSKAVKEDPDNETSQSEGRDVIINRSLVVCGGEYPINISKFNAARHGEQYMLSALPPTIEHRNIKLPRSDFFSNSLWEKAYKDSFIELLTLVNSGNTTKKTKDSIHRVTITIITMVVEKVNELRLYKNGWSRQDNYRLPKYQNIWLDNKYESERKDYEYCDKLINDFYSWFTNACTASCQKDFEHGTVTRLLSYVESSIKKDIKDNLITVKGDLL